MGSMVKCFPKSKENIAMQKGRRGENKCLTQCSTEEGEMLVCGRLSRSEEKERALGISDVFWVTSVRTDGPAFPADSPKAITGEARCACLYKTNCEGGQTSTF